MVNKVIIGFLIMTILASGVIYIELNDKARIRIDDDKSSLYVPHDTYDWIWVVGGREYNRLFDGTARLNRDLSSIIINQTIVGDTIIIIRSTGFKRGPMIVDTYTFKSIDTVELFPISHKVEIYNASGYFYRYSVDDLTGVPDKRKLIDETTFSFGRNIKVELHPNYRWAWIGYPYGSDSISAQYDIDSDYEVFNVRLFDPVENFLLLDGYTADTDYELGTVANISCFGTTYCCLDIDALGYGDNYTCFYPSGHLNFTTFASKYKFDDGLEYAIINTTQDTNLTMNSYDTITGVSFNVSGELSSILNQENLCVGSCGLSTTLYQNRYKSQSFKVDTTGNISKIGILMRYTGSGTYGDIEVGVYNNNGTAVSGLYPYPNMSSLITTGTIANFSSTTDTWYYAYVTETELTADTDYVFVINSTTSTANGYYVRGDTATYDDGMFSHSTDAGSKWTISTTLDLAFKIYLNDYPTDQCIDWNSDATADLCIPGYYNDTTADQTTFWDGTSTQTIEWDTGGVTSFYINVSDSEDIDILTADLNITPIQYGYTINQSQIYYGGYLASIAYESCQSFKTDLDNINRISISTYEYSISSNTYTVKLGTGWGLSDLFTDTLTHSDMAPYDQFTWIDINMTESVTPGTTYYFCIGRASGSFNGFWEYYNTSVYADGSRNTTTAPSTYATTGDHKFKIYGETYPKDIEIDTGIDGTKDYDGTGEMTVSTVVDVNSTAIETYCEDNRGVSVCQVPFTISSSQGGSVNITIHALNYTVNPIQTDIEGTGYSVVNVSVIDEGSLNITDLNVSFDGDVTYNITANNGTVNTSLNLNIYHSVWDYQLPSNIDYIEFIPSTPTSDNVEPYGQASTRPILNISISENNTKNTSWYFMLYDEVNMSCIDTYVATTHNTSASSIMANNTWYELIVNETAGTDTDIFLWANYSCSFTTWKMWQPEYYFRACCDSCVCSTDLI